MGVTEPVKDPALAQAPTSAAVNEGDDPILAFADGCISRQQAMRPLNIGYSELLDRVSMRRLPTPQVNGDEAERLAKLIVDLAPQ